MHAWYSDAMANSRVLGLIRVSRLTGENMTWPGVLTGAAWYYEDGALGLGLILTVSRASRLGIPPTYTHTRTRTRAVRCALLGARAYRVLI